MGFKDAGWAYTLGLPLKHTAVLAALALHTDDKTHETIVGQQKLARELGAGVKTVQRSVGDLEALGVITRERRKSQSSGYRTTDRVVLNVTSYQASESQGTNSRLTNRPEPEDKSSLPGEQIDGAIEDHPLINPGHPVLSRRKRATPIPDSWFPNEAHRDIVLTKTGISLSDEAEAFRDHALANDRRLVDWDAGFRNWLRKARPGPAPNTPAERMRATLALASVPDRRAIHRGDPHDHHDDGHGNCPICQERFDPLDESA